MERQAIDLQNEILALFQELQNLVGFTPVRETAHLAILTAQANLKEEE